MRVIIAITAFLIIYSCAPQVIEYHAKIGTLVDWDTGFWAYKTALDANRQENVFVTIASKRLIQGSQEVHTPNVQIIYPIEAHYPHHIFLRTEDVTKAIPFDTTNASDIPGSITLGYFMYHMFGVGKLSKYIDHIEDGNTEGVKWANSTSVLEEQIAKHVLKMRDYAASYGADGIVDVTVFYQEMQWLYGKGGFYISGRVIAIDARGEVDSVAEKYWFDG
jgi:hypothetical protein